MSWLAMRMPHSELSEESVWLNLPLQQLFQMLTYRNVIGFYAYEISIGKRFVDFIEGLVVMNSTNTIKIWLAPGVPASQTTFD